MGDPEMSAVWLAPPSPSEAGGEGGRGVRDIRVSGGVGFLAGGKGQKCVSRTIFIEHMLYYCHVRARPIPIRKLS